MTSEPKRIALIHALAESRQPTHDAFAEIWPEAFIFDLLDTSLSEDRVHAGRLTEAIQARFCDLSRYALSSEGKGGKTAGILFTCSAFGPAIEAVKNLTSIPVLSPNEAAFEAALNCGTNLGLVVSFGPSKASLENELLEMARKRNRQIRVTALLAEGALRALKAGEPGRHDAIVAKTVGMLGDVDAVILGQFSLARARMLIVQHCHIPVITTPESAVLELKSRLG